MVPGMSWPMGTTASGPKHISPTTTIRMRPPTPPPNASEIGISAANSPDVNGSGHELANGYYCFRAEAHLTNYNNPDAATNTTTECFRDRHLRRQLTRREWFRA